MWKLFRLVLTGIIILVIACASTVTLAIRNTANNIVKDYEESHDITGTISFDRGQLSNNFKGGEDAQKSNIEAFNNIESITLDDVKNYEADLGFDKTIGNFNIRPKIFYSVLKDYIYNTGTKFENIDAKIYGLDISGLYAMTDNLSLDYGVAYQKGKKDGDFTDKDLAEIPPLKGNFALNYEMDKAKYTAEVVAVDSWNNFDSSAREQELAGYALFNLKYNNQLHKNIGLTLGVDNVFDKVYNSTNTYQDITYATVGSDRVLINDPGRYGYVNLKYSF